MSGQIHELFLFEDLKLGKEYAFDYFFHYYYPGMCVYAQQILKASPTDAKSVVQDVFVKIWEDRAKITITSSFRSYLFSSVRNRCIDLLRKKKLQTVSYDMIRDLPDETIDTYVLAELEQIFHSAIKLIPERCREVFELSRMKGLKNKEVAIELGISEKTVENQITKALKILRHELRDYLPLLILFQDYIWLK